MNAKQKRYICICFLLLFQFPLLNNIFALASQLFPKLLSLKLDSFGDFRQQVLCAYTMRGVNPYNPSVVLDDVGAITEGFATSPWGLTLGNIFYPAFIPIEYGCLYMTVFSLIVMVITGGILVSYFKKQDDGDDITILIMTLVLTSASMWMAILNRNASCIIACFIVLSIIYKDNKQILSGVFLGFAMVKPQMCGLICLIFLFEKKLKPLFIAAAIDISGYTATCILLKENPVSLFIQFMNSDVGVVDGNPDPYYGIFSFLLPHGVEESVVTILSALFGIIITTISYFILKEVDIHNQKIKDIIIFSPALICSHVWSYGWNLDKGTLIPVVILFAILLVKMNKFNPLLYLGLCTSMLSPSAYYLVHKLSGRVSYESGIAGGACAFISLIPILLLCKNKEFIDELNIIFSDKEKTNAVS